MTRASILLLCIAACAAIALCQSDPLGSHNVGGHGCVLCHVPSAGLNDTAEVQEEGALWMRTSATPETVLASGSLNADRPLFHTFVCLTCHDGSLASLGLMGRRVELGKGIEPATDLDLARANDSHPVHVPYLPNDGCGVDSINCNPDHWPSTVDAKGSLSWMPDRFSDNFDAVYGRPVRFYPTADNGGRAMVECSTCHNPHSMQTARFKLAGKVQSRPSQAFLRGWYETQGQYRDTVSKFCRSCHYAQSGDAVNMRETFQ